MVMRVMISNGLRGKKDPTAYVDDCRKAVVKHFQEIGKEIELVNTYFPDFNGNRIQFLGKSISNGIAVADVVVFMDDWYKYAGCCCEKEVCHQYRVPYIEIKSGSVQAYEDECPKEPCSTGL